MRDEPLKIPIEVGPLLDSARPAVTPDCIAALRRWLTRSSHGPLFILEEMARRAVEAGYEEDMRGLVRTVEIGDVHRAQVLRALTELQPVVQQTLELLGSEEPWARFDALSKLREVPLPEAVPLLLILLADEARVGSFGLDQSLGDLAALALAAVPDLSPDARLALDAWLAVRRQALAGNDRDAVKLFADLGEPAALEQLRTLAEADVDPFGELKRLADGVEKRNFRHSPPPPPEVS